MVDVVAVPDGLEDAVAEAEDEDVLNSLLAEVVIDAEDLVFVERTLLIFVVELRGRSRGRVPKGFSMMTRTQTLQPSRGLRSGLAMPCSPRWLMMSAEVLGRGGEVEEAVAAGVELVVELGELAS